MVKSLFALFKCVITDWMASVPTYWSCSWTKEQLPGWENGGRQRKEKNRRRKMRHNYQIFQFIFSIQVKILKIVMKSNPIFYTLYHWHFICNSESIYLHLVITYTYFCFYWEWQDSAHLTNRERFYRMDISFNFCKEVMKQEGAVSWRAAGRLHTSNFSNQLYFVLLFAKLSQPVQHEIRSRLQSFLADFFIRRRWIILVVM